MHGLTLVVSRPSNSRLEPEPSPAHALVDFLTEGSSFHPRLPDAEALPFLGDLAAAMEALASRDRARATVRLGLLPEPWELGLERAGLDVLVSLFQGGAVPDVALFEKRVDGDLLAARALDALHKA